jgi:hypothetical protein
MGADRLTDSPDAIVELGVARWELQSPSGDTYVAVPAAGAILLAVIDGLGHGRDAAHAAQIAAAVLAERPGEGVLDLLARCHRDLGGTRGAVATLVSVRGAGTIAWVGVGNVAGLFVGLHEARARRRMVSRPGTLGHALREPRAETLPVAPGDAILLATDGVDAASLDGFDRRETAQTNAERILAVGCTHTDDALVLVARFRGTGGE